MISFLDLAGAAEENDGATGLADLSALNAQPFPSF
jgi:hypothetical protein